MRPKTTHIWIVFAVLFIAYIFIKLYGDPIVQNLYEDKKIELLNQLTGASAQQPLSFYQGKLENILWGPAKSLLAGLLFLMVCWKYLRMAGPFYFGLAVLFYLILSRPEVLTYPPYGESITGPFSDAIWLIQHNMDYIGLLHQDTFAKYGPQIYPLSIYPLFLACLMWILPTGVFLFVIHMLVFVMGAGILVIIREALSKLFDRDIGLLAAVLFLSFPLFQSMVELINLEIPNLFFALLAVWFLYERKIKFAGLMATLSLLVKVPGFIVSFLVFVVSAVFFVSEFFVSKDKLHKKKLVTDLIAGLATFLFAVTIGLLRNKMTGPQPINNKLSLFIGWWPLHKNVWFWLFVFLSVVFIVELIRFFIKSRNEKGKWNLFLEKYFLITLFFLAACFWFLMYLNFSVIAYRYQFLVEGFIVVCGVYVLCLLLKKKSLVLGTLGVSILVSLFLSHGLFYDLRNMRSFNPTELERSLEYRNYLKAELLTVEEMVKHYSDFTIGAPYGMAQSLAIPQLGYVQKSLDVRLYGIRATLGIKPFEGLKKIKSDKIVWIGYAFDEVMGGKVKYPFDPETDHLIKRIIVGDNEVIIFHGGIAIEKMRILADIHQLGLSQAFMSGQLDPRVLKRIVGSE